MAFSEACVEEPNEKRPLLHLLSKRQAQRPRPQPSPRQHLYLLLVVNFVLLGWIWLGSHQPKESGKEPNESAAKEQSGEKPWTWSDIHPSRNLEWETCYEILECARLDVPMDWKDPSDDKRVILGIIKYPAKRKDDPVPPLFFNPGGPGGSGVNSILTLGPYLQAVAGDNYDVISWDPRGVGVSTPRMECWNDMQKRALWGVGSVYVMDAYPGVTYDFYAQQNAFSQTCEQAMNETGILPFLSTASHARDMLEILEKTGHDKLRYWGVSYGTVLGGVFAGLFPERVERLVSDGNVDYGDWINSMHSSFLQDTDKIFDAFDQACHRVGPVRCALWAETPQAVQARRAGILEDLKKHPILIPAWAYETGPEMPEVITYSKIQILTRTIAYNPQALSEVWANLYASLGQGDGTYYYNFIMAISNGFRLKQLCQISDTSPFQPVQVPVEPDAFPAIMCTDGLLPHHTPESWEVYVHKMMNMSKWAGASYAFTTGSCTGWKTQAKWRFTEEDFHADTASPILYIGNTGDNVTPLESAYNNSARFPSSRVMVQDSYGHSSLSAPSICTALHIRNYFQTGTLPPEGTICKPDYSFFEYPRPGMRQQSEDELSNAIFELSERIDLAKMMTMGL